LAKSHKFFVNKERDWHKVGEDQNPCAYFLEEGEASLLGLAFVKFQVVLFLEGAP
jgi:hypothetical protein